MSNAEQQYREAWERLKAGKPNIVSKDKPINERDTVAEEAGRQKGSLRTKDHPDLCKEIMEYEVSETSLQECTRLKQEYKEKMNENAKLWKSALARELMLQRRIIDLEIEIKRIKQKYPGILFELEDLNS